MFIDLENTHHILSGATERGVQHQGADLLAHGRGARRTIAQAAEPVLLAERGRMYLTPFALSGST